MINLFFNNDKWDISTRSNIGCNNRNKNKSFKSEIDKKKKNFIRGFIMFNIIKFIK